MTSKDNTLAALRWAKEQAQRDQIVREFWKKLAEAVSEPESASAERIYAELRAYGGNTFANAFRDGEGVTYHEVAKDVAHTLAPMLKSSPYGYSTIDACERYVLEKMEVSAQDIEMICSGIRAQGGSEALRRAATEVGIEAAAASAIVGVAVKVGGQAAIEKAVSTIGAEKVTSFVAAKIAEQAAKKAAQVVAKKAAQEAAKKAAQEVAKQAVARIIAAMNVFLALVTVISIAGPAKRKTIPAVTYVALLRSMFSAAQCGY